MHKGLALLMVVATIFPCVAKSAEIRAGSSTGDPELVEELLATIPTLDSKDESIQSFEFTGRLPSLSSPTRPIHARIGWSREAGTAVVLSTVEKTTPILWAAENDALICDFTSPTLTVVNNVHPSVMFGIAGGEVKYRYRLNARSVAHSIDLRSLPRAFGSSWSISREDHVTTLSQDSPSGRSTMILRFRHAPEPRFLSLVMHANDHQRTVLNSIDSIRVNKPLSPALVRFPAQLLAKQNFQHARMDGRSRSDLLSLTSLISRTLTIPPLLHDAALRDRLKPRLLVNDVDWDDARKRFDFMGPQLRQILQDVDRTVYQPNEAVAGSRKQSNAR